MSAELMNPAAPESGPELQVTEAAETPAEDTVKEVHGGDKLKPDREAMEADSLHPAEESHIADSDSAEAESVDVTEPGLDFSRLDVYREELERQAEAIKQRIPGFDLQRELAVSPELRRFTAPGSPLSLSEALCFAKLPQLMAIREARNAARLKESLAKSIAAGTALPAGIRQLSRSPTGGMMSEGEWERVKERVRRGERIRP